MKKPMKKGAKICLGILLVAALIGACFASVALYAKREMNKPKFILPVEAPQYVSEDPANVTEAADYAARLYAAAATPDDALVTMYTDVSFEGDWRTPFAEADTQTLQYMSSRAAAEIAALYPAAEDAVAAQTELPQAHTNAADVLGFTAEPVRKDNGEPDETRLVLRLTVNPDSIDAQSLPQSGIYAQIAKTLSDALTVERVQIVPVSADVRMEIDRFTGRLLAADITNAYRVQASIRLAGNYRALSAQDTVEVELPYRTTRHVAFTYFGARFTERAIAVNPGDRKALPAAVSVRSDAQKSDYTISFASSVPDALSFDDDGVMTVGRVVDEPVTVTMTLEYGGHTYTDTLTVYITQWEVTAGD